MQRAIEQRFERAFVFGGANNARGVGAHDRIGVSQQRSHFFIVIFQTQAGHCIKRVGDDARIGIAEEREQLLIPRAQVSRARLRSGPKEL